MQSPPISDGVYVLSDDTERGGSPGKPDPPLPHSGSFHTFLGTLVHSKDFQRTVIALILLNSITLGIATFDFVTENPSMDQVFDTVDTVFLVIFSVELGLQFLYHGFGLFSEGWLTFDVVVVTLSWMFMSIQVVRAFRIVRAFRVVTRIRELRDLVDALLSVIPRLFAIILLLMLVDYVFATMFTQLFKELYEEGHLSGDYFGRLDRTAFTLFQIMTLDGWSTIAREVLEAKPWAWLPFVAFVSVSSFIVINLMIAVICDAVATLQKEQMEEKIVTIQSMTESITQQNNDEIKELQAKVDQLQQLIQQMSADLRQLAQSGTVAPYATPHLTT